MDDLLDSVTEPTLEELIEEKAKARMDLLSLPPEEAQKRVNSVLYPHLWEFNPRASNPNDSLMPTGFEYLDDLDDFEYLDDFNENFESTESPQNFLSQLENSSISWLDESLDSLNGVSQMWTPEQLLETLTKLQKAKCQPLIVGGQAINLWATYYQSQVPSLQNYAPFSSEDLDLFGSRLDVHKYHETLGGKAFYAKDFDPTPNSGIIILPLENGNLRIDILSSVLGLNDNEVVGMSLSFQGKDSLKDLHLRILHPVLCMEAKLRGSKNLPQHNRQDAKHAQMSVLIVNAFLQEQISANQTRTSLAIINRILRQCTHETTLSAWYHHKISIEQAIPIDLIERQSDPRWKLFLEKHWPRCQKYIKDRKLRYETLMQKIQERKSQNLP